MAINKSDNVIEPFPAVKLMESAGRKDPEPRIIADDMAFDTAVAQYYRQKAIEHDPFTVEDISATEADSENLAQRLLIMPVSEPRHVLVKLNILENELSADMDLEAPVDRKHLLMFAALKVDLMKLMADMS
jgi:hypothetical protein